MQAKIETYFQVGQRLTELKSYAIALSFLETAVNLSDREERWLRINANLSRLICLEKLKRFDEMQKLSRQLLDEHGGQGHLEIEALLYENLGLASSGLREYDAAVDALRQALKIQEKLSAITAGNKFEIARLNFALGFAARSAGKFEEVFPAFETARNIWSEGGERWSAAMMLSEIGITWFKSGEYARAREILEAAALEAEKLNRPRDAAKWRAQFQPSANDNIHELVTSVGALLREKPPNTSAAKRLAVICIRKAQEANDQDIEAEALNCLGLSYGFERKYYQALPRLRKAIRLALKLNNKPLEIKCRTNLAMVLTKLGSVKSLKDAEQELRTAIKIGVALRTAAKTTEFRQSITAGLANTYDTLALLLATPWQRSDGVVIASRQNELIELVQETRAVNFAGWLALEDAFGKSGSDVLQDLLLKYRAGEVRLEMTALAKGTGIKPLVDQQANLRQQLQKAAAGYGLQVNFESPVYTTSELRRMLSPGQCLIDLYAAPKVVVISVLDSRGELDTAICRWPHDERMSLLQRWKVKVFDKSQGDLQKARFRGIRGSEAEGKTQPEVAASKISLAALLEELSERFFQTLVNLLTVRESYEQITIVPHRELSLIPFWTLSAYLPDVRISVIPGTNIHKLLYDRQVELIGLRVALGDCTGTLKYVTSELAHLPRFSLLPFRINEVIQQLTCANLVHMACHGEFNEKNPYAAGLVVEKVKSGREPRPYGARTRFKEELLTVAEVLATMRLPHCYLAVLSACCSGLPRQHSASEFMSLPAALLIAGVRNVIASLWPVSDAATCLLMQEFYDALFQGELAHSSPSKALAIARIKLSHLTHKEVVNRLGRDVQVPSCDPPFAGPEYTLAFQHYGVD